MPPSRFWLFAWPGAPLGLFALLVAQWKLARLEVGERSILMQEMPAERQMALAPTPGLQLAGC